MHGVNLNNRFEYFFRQTNYALLKNLLYNYRLRRAAVSRYLQTQRTRVILEAGCGLSPVSNQYGRTVFMDLSFQGLAVLKHLNNAGAYVVADCGCLPFKSGVFSHSVSSEVLEHIPADGQAIAELGRVTQPGGRLVVTFPHRKAYYAYDDRYVGHFRRYERPEMEQLLTENGFKIENVQKVLGPLEKVAMMTAVFIYESLQKKAGRKNGDRPIWFQYAVQTVFGFANSVFMAVVWLEAKLLPVSLATVLMMVGHRRR